MANNGIFCLITSANARRYLPRSKASNSAHAGKAARAADTAARMSSALPLGTVVNGVPRAGSKTVISAAEIEA